ncbi:NnrU family protein [Phenylobacterium sp.]|jgi:uncharacterized membrane protein|uniref:NnrU family protein n=1 Tax=Phenylobacterium sp. TaxID=1871053 RepID=UPI002F930D45
MLNLVAAAAFFVLIHLAISGTRVRDVLVARIGAGPYMGLFSLLSLGGIVWLGWAFAGTRATDEALPMWGMSAATHGLQFLLQLVAVLFIVVGLTTPNPTSVRQEAVLDRPEPVRGMLRITRHPFLWGVALWAIGHLLVNGDAGSLILFGSMLALALFGTASIDAKRKRALGAKWDLFAVQTSNIPFLAILQGRQRLALQEIGAWRILAAVAVWVGLILAHPYLFGVGVLY